MESCWVHIPEVVGSSPTLATIKNSLLTNIESFVHMKSSKYFFHSCSKHLREGLAVSLLDSAIYRDGVIGNTAVSKTAYLGSNPSLCASQMCLTRNSVCENPLKYFISCKVVLLSHYHKYRRHRVFSLAVADCCVICCD